MSIFGLLNPVAIIEGVKDVVSGGGDQNPRVSIEGFTVCPNNSFGETGPSVRQLVNASPLDLQNELIISMQARVDGSWSFAPVTSQRVGLPRRVTLENVAGAVMFYLGGGNDCTVGPREDQKNVETWSAWRAKALSVVGSLGGIGSPSTSPISGGGATTVPPPGDVCSRLPEPFRTDCRAAAAGFRGATSGFQDEFRREQLAQVGGIPMETLLVIGGIGLLFLINR